MEGNADLGPFVELEHDITAEDFRRSLMTHLRGLKGPQAVLGTISDAVLTRVWARAGTIEAAAQEIKSWWEERRQKLFARLRLDNVRELWPEDLIETTRNILIEHYALHLCGGKDRNRNLKPNIKDWDRLEPTTRTVYLRDIDLILQRTGGGLYPLEVACLLVDVAAKFSRSRYYTQRAAIRKVAGNNKAALEVLRLLPSYTELRSRIGAPDRPRTGPATLRRREGKDMETLGRLLARLPEGHREIMMAIILSGARRSEVSSICLKRAPYLNKEAVYVQIKNRKTGCRKKNKAEARTLVVDPDSMAGRFWLDLMGRIGPEPFAHARQGALETTWRRARTREGVAGDQAWCQHAMRHNFCAELKARLAGSEEHRKTIAAAMGHNDYAQAKIYGRAGAAAGIDIGVIAAR